MKKSSEKYTKMKIIHLGQNLGDLCKFWVKFSIFWGLFFVVPLRRNSGPEFSGIPPEFFKNLQNIPPMNFLIKHLVENFILYFISVSWLSEERI
jgi:hypothetical protein